MLTSRCEVFLIAPKIATTFVLTQKQTKADKNGYCVFQPRKTKFKAKNKNISSVCIC